MEQKMGFLPIYVLWDYKRKFYTIGVGSYAVVDYFHRDTEEFKIWCIPFPLNVSFYPFEQGISLLRCCGTPEETVNVLCNEAGATKWVEYFNNRVNNK